MEIDHRIDEMEDRRKQLRVTSLSFNTFYEFSLQRIPQLMEEMNLERSKFDIHDYAAILSTFYKGGEYEETLNSDMETSLFDEKFIVFELDQIKDNPVLAPIVLLIIMDVFTQKMRIKKCRKTLVIEEAWKAIATPSMAEYIQYLYKTARTMTSCTVTSRKPSAVIVRIGIGAVLGNPSSLPRKSRLQAVC